MMAQPEALGLNARSLEQGFERLISMVIAPFTAVMTGLIGQRSDQDLTEPGSQLGLTRAQKLAKLTMGFEEGLLDQVRRVEPDAEGLADHPTRRPDGDNCGTTPAAGPGPAHRHRGPGSRAGQGSHRVQTCRVPRTRSHYQVPAYRVAARIYLFFLINRPFPTRSRQEPGIPGSPSKASTEPALSTGVCVPPVMSDLSPAARARGGPSWKRRATICRSTRAGPTCQDRVERGRVFERHHASSLDG